MKTEKKPIRSSLPKTALPRILFIDREIASGKYPSSPEMAKKYESSLSSIGRDIAFMKYSLNAPIEYSAARRGFYYTEPNYRIPAGFSGAEDLLALGMAKSILSLYRNTPLYEAARNLLDCITAPLNSEGKDGWYENRIVVPQIPCASVNPEIWKTLIAALRENRVLTFDYHGIWGGEYKSRRVKPYQLLFDTGAWYLYGFAEDRKAIRIFSLSRMKKVMLTTVHFPLPKNFDYRSTNNESFFGVFAGQEKFHFCIGFYDESALWVQERQWAADQEIEDTDDGVVITFTSSQYQKVLEWILSRGCTALPFAPEKLVSDWHRHAMEMGRLAKKLRRKTNELGNH
jgi:predicted DNA-binding transcriptional regulator YafY